jgi:hypothetical protein
VCGSIDPTPDRPHAHPGSRDAAEAACEVASLKQPPPPAAWEATGLRPYASANNSYNAYVSSIVGFFSTKTGPQFATRIVISDATIATQQAPQLQLNKSTSIANQKALQLQLRKCFNCNFSSTSIATLDM